MDRPYKVNGEKVADFFDVVAWRGSAELVCKFFHKGKPILIQGHFENRSYNDKQGNKRYRTELFAERISFAGDSSGRDKPPRTETPPEHQTGEPASEHGGPEGFDEVPVPSDDDLPF